MKLDYSAASITCLDRLISSVWLGRERSVYPPNVPSPQIEGPDELAAYRMNYIMDLVAELAVFPAVFTSEGIHTNDSPLRRFEKHNVAIMRLSAAAVFSCKLVE